MILLLTISILPGLLVRMFGIRSVRTLGAVLISKSRDNLVRDVEERMRVLVDSYSAVLSEGRDQIETALLYQSGEVERALAAKQVTPPKKIYFSSDFNEGRNLPPDAISSSFHFQTLPDGRFKLLTVSYSTQVFKVARGIDRSDVMVDIARLSRVTPVLHQLSNQMKARIWWQDTCLSNGLLSSYPGHNGIPYRLDPRKLQWYEQAMTKKSRWSDPFVDPETRQIVTAAMKPVRRPDGRIGGVTAIILPISTLFNRKPLFQNIPPGTKSFLCYPTLHSQTGQRAIRIFAKDEQVDLTHRSWRVHLEPEWLTSGDPKQFQEMLNDFATGVAKTRQMPYDRVDSLWVYGATQTGAFLVLITPYDEILKPAIASEKFIDDRINRLINLVAYVGIGVIILVVILAFAFSRTVTKPIQVLAEGAKRLAAGEFDARVRIRSRDEFGEMGRVFNSVGPRLKEHYAIRKSLELAMEVQQNLLPAADPVVEGLDIAGESYYCEKTGGDYYDYLERSEQIRGRTTIVVGDVSDHGIPSALLMTTARALLRQRSSRHGGIQDIVTDVNRQLTRDTEHSGQFMTLFYCEIDAAEKWIRWVRAGHEPAMVYDPGTDAFQVLLGRGICLGVLGNEAYEANQRGIVSGQIILIGTDGIWEARNARGKMYGKKTLQALIRQNARASAKDILLSILHSLQAFIQPLELEDDVTLVVVKVL